MRWFTVSKEIVSADLRIKGTQQIGAAAERLDAVVIQQAAEVRLVQRIYLQEQGSRSYPALGILCTPLRLNQQVLPVMAMNVWASKVRYFFLLFLLVFGDQYCGKDSVINKKGGDY